MNLTAKITNLRYAQLSHDPLHRKLLRAFDKRTLVERILQQAFKISHIGPACASLNSIKLSRTTQIR